MSPSLARDLTAVGIDITHIAFRGRDGMPDHELWEYARDHDRVVITMNVSDFLRLAERAELHAGLIVIRRGGLTREEQRAWIEPVIEKLETEETDLVNRVVEVTDVGVFVVRDLPT